jgi:hypothetical protein
MALDSSHESPPAPNALSLAEKAIALENSYKELLLQGDEVNQRIQLWQNALEICVAATDGVAALLCGKLIADTLVQAQY